MDNNRLRQDAFSYQPMDSTLGNQIDCPPEKLNHSIFEIEQIEPEARRRPPAPQSR